MPLRSPSSKSRNGGRFKEHEVEDYPGCKHASPFMRTHLTIHGLWPDVFDHHPHQQLLRPRRRNNPHPQRSQHPGFCTHERFDRSNLAEFMEEMLIHWPNVKQRQGSSTYDEFWAHEWSRHGTCSNLNQSTYFRATLDLQKQRASTPTFNQEHVGDLVALQDVRRAFREWHNTTLTDIDVVLKCEKGGAHTFLSQVFACMGKDAKTGYPSKLIPCPKTILHEDTCKHVEQVLILAFPDHVREGLEQKEEE